MTRKEKIERLNNAYRLIRWEVRNMYNQCLVKEIGEEFTEEEFKTVLSILPAELWIKYSNYERAQTLRIIEDIVRTNEKEFQ